MCESDSPLGEGAVATAPSCDLCARHFPLTQPLPRSGGEENERRVNTVGQSPEEERHMKAKSGDNGGLRA